MCVRRMYVCVSAKIYVCEWRMYVCESARMNYGLNGPSYTYILLLHTYIFLRHTYILYICMCV